MIHKTNIDMALFEEMRVVRVEAKFLTDRGQVRQRNEDAGGIFHNQSNQLLAVVADGMGGHQAGDIASQLAVSLLEERWQKVEQLSSPEETEQWLIKTISELNTIIYERSLQHE